MTLFRAWQKIGEQSGFNSWQVGINIPLWFGPQKAEIQAASIQKEIAESRLKEETISLQSQYRQLVQEFGKISRTVNYYRDQALPLARQQLQAAAKSYRLGEIDYTGFFH